MAKQSTKKPQKNSILKTNSQKPLSDGARPKSINEALVALLWESKFGKLVLIMLVLLLALFAIWVSLPDANKSSIISRLMKKDDRQA